MSDKPLVVVGVEGGVATTSEWPPDAIDVLLLDWDELELGDEELIREAIADVKDEARIPDWFRAEVLDSLQKLLTEQDWEATEEMLASTSHEEEVSPMGSSRLDSVLVTIEEVIATRQSQSRTAAVALLQSAAQAIKAERDLSAAGYQK